jgi:hypothetical protein
MTTQQHGGPVNRQGYIPYFYESGRHLRYPPLGSENPPDRMERPIGRYDLAPAGYLLGPTPTVEQIIQKGYLAVPVTEPETALLSDKHLTAKLGLEDVIGQVRRRREIYQQNIYQIQLGKCYAISAMFTQEAYNGGIPAAGMEVHQTNKELQDFYRQERDERVRLWQDLSRLRQHLPESAQEYLGAHRKLAILDDQPGDL